MQIGRIPFDANESNVIDALSRWTRILAALHFGCAVFLGIQAAMVLLLGAGGTFSRVASGRFATSSEFVVLGVLGSLGLLVGLFVALQGVWLLRASDAFRLVVTTDGQDEAMIVKGFGQLRSLFWVDAIVAAIGLLVVCARVATRLL